MTTANHPADCNSAAHQKQLIAQLAKGGDIERARKLCAALCEQSPGDPETWFLLGAIHGAVEDYPKAEDCCRKAVALAPTHAMLRYNLAIALIKQGKVADAIKQFERAVELQPGFADAYRELGNARHMNNEPRLALSSYTRALELDPDSALTLLNLGNLHMQLRQQGEAIDFFRKAVARQPDMIDAYAGLGSALIHQFKFDRAIDLLEAGTRRVQDAAPLYPLLAVAYQEQGDADIALEYYRKALARTPDSVDARVGIASITAMQGHYAEAGEMLESLLASEPDNSTVKMTYATFGHHFGAGDRAREIAEREIASESASNKAKARHHFTLARMHEKHGGFDNAFEHYAAGNRLRGAVFDHASYKRMFQALMDNYSAQAVERLPRSDNKSDGLIFIVGMPRSGTSLAEHILASHPEVFGAGELRDINYLVDNLAETLGTGKPYPFCLDALTTENLNMLAAKYEDSIRQRSGGHNRYFTDKLPINFIHMGFINLLFPNARFVHCTRDPRDTCLSCYFQLFAGELPYAYSLSDLGKFYRLYQTLMNHWKQVLPAPIYELNYERMVLDQENETRKLIEFCGLDWDDACLDFHNTDRTVATASYDQVRQPIYSKSIGRWRAYEKHLQPLLDALGLTT